MAAPMQPSSRWSEKVKRKKKAFSLQPDFYKLSRTFIFLVGQGLDPLVIELDNHHLVGWALCRHKLLLTYNEFFSLEFNVLIALDFDYACSFLACLGK